MPSLPGKLLSLLHAKTCDSTKAEDNPTGKTASLVRSFRNKRQLQTAPAVPLVWPCTVAFLYIVTMLMCPPGPKSPPPPPPPTPYPPTQQALHTYIALYLLTVHKKGRSCYLSQPKLTIQGFIQDFEVEGEGGGGGGQGNVLRNRCSEIEVLTAT